MAAIRAGSRARKTKRAGAKKRASGSWKSVFLAALAETSNVTQSADRAHISPGHVYKTRRADPQFRQQWRAALCEGYDHLEMEVLRRLRAGDCNTADGGKFDFASSLRILSAHQAAVGAERARQNNYDEATVLAAINAKIAAFRRCKEAGAKPAAAILIEQSDAACR
ncbi:hypothetical protein [Porphyrobacter sp. GA68]|uniref:hypothetical protein n=1 Tax=Porphyrobacter sp. GA68 TaxID=2883480 RepID=UPI001D1889DC|nr:hypothetical protein [Porphyrobacter sp. GA68]